MSYSFVVSGNSAILATEFHPPIYLEENNNYAIGLVNFETFNAVPNIDESNNRLFYGATGEFITIPPGSYEIDDIDKLLQEKLGEKNISFYLHANNNTLRSIIKCSENIIFRDGSIGMLLGFNNQILALGQIHISERPAEIIKVNSINIDCSIAEGSYLNGSPVHIIHQFFPSVAPGFKIIESPQNVIYFPVTAKVIDKIVIKILDQEGEFVNFREEVITIRLHLKKLEE